MERYYYYSTSGFNSSIQYTNYTDNEQELNDEKDFFNWIIEFECTKEEIENIDINIVDLLSSNFSCCSECEGIYGNDIYHYFTCNSKDIENVSEIVKEIDPNFIVHTHNISQNIKLFESAENISENELRRYGLKTKEQYLEQLRVLFNITF